MMRWRASFAPALRLVAQWVLVGGSAGLLYWAGEAHLGGFPLWHPSALAAWTARKGLIVSLFAAVRLVLLGLAGYWLVVSSGVALWSLTRGAGRIGNLVRRCPIPGAGRAATFTLGAWIAGASAIATNSGPSSVPADHAASGPPVLVPLGPPAPPAPQLIPAPPPAVAPRGHRLQTGARRPPSLARRPQVVVHRPSLPPARPSPPSHPKAAAPPADATITVQPGDNLWAIAAAALQRATGVTPTDRAVATYWLQLIRVNRSRLPNPDDPSLLFPGDVIALPIPDGAD